MLNRTIRQRFNPTYSQTFQFTDPPLQNKKVSRCSVQNCDGCQHCRNIIEHYICKGQTQQQILHKTILWGNKQNKQKETYSLPQTIISQPNVSFKVKQKQLRGQLEQGGVQFFQKQFSHDNKCRNYSKLIPTDCSFSHNCYGQPGLMNELCKFNRARFDRFLKNQYDLKHRINICKCPENIFVFKQKVKISKNKKK